MNFQNPMQTMYISFHFYPNACWQLWKTNSDNIYICTDRNYTTSPYHYKILNF